MAQYIASIFDKGNGVIKPYCFQTIVNEYRARERFGENIEVIHLKDNISNSNEPRKYRFIIGGQSISKDDRYFVEKLIPFVNGKGFDETQAIHSNIVMVSDNQSAERINYKKCMVKIKKKIKIH
jgi:hypothetical protein